MLSVRNSFSILIEYMYLIACTQWKKSYVIVQFTFLVTMIFIFTVFSFTLVLSNLLLSYMLYLNFTVIQCIFLLLLLLLCRQQLLAALQTEILQIGSSVLVQDHVAMHQDFCCFISHLPSHAGSVQNDSRKHQTKF